MDAQAEDFFAMRHQGGWQLLAVKVFGDQGVVGRFQAVLHGQVQAGRGFAAATHTHQNHLGRIQVAVGLPIVVRQRKVDGFYPVVVFLAFAHI